MKKTIHYMSDIKWFSQIRSTKYSSKRHMVRAHIDYIDKNAVEKIGDKKTILDTVDLLDKKENSRVAFSFNIAIPNDIQRNEYKQFLQDVVRFFSKKFNIDEKNIYAVIHETHQLGKELGTENKHIHIVANTRTKQDKQIRIQPKDLKQLHKDWDAFLQQKGYIIENKGMKERVFGINIRKDKELQNAYKNYLQARKELEEVERIKAERKQKEFAMRLSVASERDTKPYPTEFGVKDIKTVSELKEIVRRSYYSNIIWEDGYRSGKNAKRISNFIVFDIDGTDDIYRVAKMLEQKGLRALITTTKSHTQTEHHFRIIIKTNREIQENELLYYKHMMRLLANDLGIQVDRATFDLARMYAPNQNAQFIFIASGKELNIDRYIEQAKEEYEKELVYEWTKQLERKRQSQPNQKEHWIYADFDSILDIDIQDLIEHFEGISKRWKEGSQVYVKTGKGNKYDINKNWNVCYNFYEMKGYGVLSYLQEQLGTNHLLNIATYLEKNNLATGIIKINEDIFNSKIRRCLSDAINFNDFIELLKDEFNVKSVFIDMENKTIKIGQFRIELDDELFDDIKEQFKPTKPSKPRSPGV